MNSKEKENALSKIKQFFKMSKSPGTFPELTEFTLTPEIEQELSPENSMQQRIRTLTNLGREMQTKRLEECSLQKLLDLTNDFLAPERPFEHRQIGFLFYKQLIQGQFENLAGIRAHFFRVIQNHNVPEDVGFRLDLLKTLTDNGKDIKFIDKEIGQFMVQWAQTITDASLLKIYLEILDNLIQFNAAYLDKNVVVGIVNLDCYLLSYTVDNLDIVPVCLSILDNVICYASLPKETLQKSVFVLCKTVTKEKYCEASWKIMRKLLGTDLGHAALWTMCSLMSDQSNYGDEHLLCGAVFHTNMGLWGSSAPLRCSTSSALMSFCRVLKSLQFTVSYEVAVSVQRLITNQGFSLTEITWGVICDILIQLNDNIKYFEKINIRNNSVSKVFHDIVDNVESLIVENQIQISQEMFYNLIEMIADDRSDKSVALLMDYKIIQISASRPRWIQALCAFMEKFYKNFKRTNIRVKAIESLKIIMDMNRMAYEEEILERVFLVHRSNILNERDPIVRLAMSKLLIDLALNCETKRCLELLSIIEVQISVSVDPKDKDLCNNIAFLIEGLIRVFVSKLYVLPSLHAIAIYHMLVAHLEKHYTQYKDQYSDLYKFRYMIFVWMFKARANSTFHIGYPDSKTGIMRFSNYLGVDAGKKANNEHATKEQQAKEEKETNYSMNQESISIRRGCRAILSCIETEKNWIVLELVLQGIPIILQNKALIEGNDVDSLGKKLFHLFHGSKTILKELVVKTDDDKEQSSTKPSESAFQALVLPGIAGLLSYHQSLEQITQKCMIDCLTKGLNLGNPKICVQAMTVMVLEITDTFIRYVPDVLLGLSKMSNTPLVAIPVLEFLSTLSRLPHNRFANFVRGQYMCVFAIALPYTNPYKYDHYIVSLAHHVIAGWFLKSRLSLRQNFVKYIIAGLDTHINIAFQENKNQLPMVNEDSSNRKRSSSLTEQGSRKQKQQSNDKLYEFHMDLAETCIDFMARHTYSPCSAVPKRLPTTDFLLAGGQSMTWLVGHNIITINTSGCSSTSMKNGLCDRCALLCKVPSQSGVIPKSAGVGSGPNNKSAQESESTDLTSTSTSSSALSAQNSQQQRFHLQRQSSSDGRFSSSSGSLEALSRRGSNPDTESTSSEPPPNRHQLDNPISIPSSLNQSPNLFGSQQDNRVRQMCICTCIGWAEIMIRRPTGTISWVMRIQNNIYHDLFSNEMPIWHDLSNLFMPSFGAMAFNSPATKSISPIQEKFLAETTGITENLEPIIVPVKREEKPVKLDLDLEQKKEVSSSKVASSGPIDIPKQPPKVKESGSISDHEEGSDADENAVPFDDQDGRSRNPVRRVNSSPEMSSNYRNPFLMNQNKASSNQSGDEPGEGQENQEGQQKKKTYCKDMRVSCEAIPEEMTGQTPPSTVGSVSNDSILDELVAQSAKPVPQEVVKKPEVAQEEPKKELEFTHKSPKKQIDEPKLQTNLKIPIEAPQKITAKPPQSPVPLSPRLLAKNSGNRFGTGFNTLSLNEVVNSNNNEDLPRGRSKTISVTRERYTKHSNIKNSNLGPGQGSNISPFNHRSIRSDQPLTIASNTSSGISPSFVFLQLFHTSQSSVHDRPLLVDSSNENAIKLLDYIAPFETHKIGVLYIGPGQCNNETEILKNRCGSYRYTKFLTSLGNLISIKDAKDNNMCIDLEPNSDGKYTYIWQDDSVQVLFHVATLMPTNEQDTNCIEKKKHIGNDFVTIVYNESGEEYNPNTLKAQLNYACVVVEPLELKTNRIFIKVRDTQKVEFMTHWDSKIVSDDCAPLLARQLALHANLASMISWSLQNVKHGPYASNWLERLRKIKRLRQKLLDTLYNNGTKSFSGSSGSGPNTGNNNNAGNSSQEKSHITDFTKYTH